MLKNGVLTLELSSECPSHLYEFTTFRYTGGNLFIDGELVGYGFEECVINNILILLISNKKLEITPDMIIYNDNGELTKYVYGKDERFAEAEKVIDRIMAESPTTIDIDGQPIIAIFDKMGLHLCNGKDYQSFLQLISLSRPPKIQYKDLLLLKPAEVWVAQIYKHNETE